jgi:hypothetical protein
VGQNDDASASSITSAVRFFASQGATYWVAVDGFNGATGNVRLSARALPEAAVPPANDQFAKAEIVRSGNYVTNVSSVAATIEIGEPLHAGQPGGHSLWWAFTAPSNGLALLSTKGSTFDTLLAVYTGTSLSNLVSVAANDDDPQITPASTLVFRTVAGTTYYIAVDGYNGAAGTVVLELNQSPELQPRMLARFANGKLSLGVDNGPTASLLIESSSDLLHWQAISTLRSGDEFIVDVPESSDANFGRRFYRTRIAAE